MQLILALPVLRWQVRAEKSKSEGQGKCKGLDCCWESGVRGGLQKVPMLKLNDDKVEGSSIGGQVMKSPVEKGLKTKEK